MTTISYPKKNELAQQPTPLQLLTRLSQRWGTTVFCKRDDLTGSTLTGNKVRKLEFLMADAIGQGCGAVVTCGGEQSNHARATAIAAATLGLQCHLLLRTADPGRPPATDGNILLDRMVGAQIQWITPDQYRTRDTLLPEVAQQVGRQHGTTCYVIPEGGSNEIGAWGYVRCVEELAQQLGDQPATIVHAVGSGGTTAGLLAGCKLLQLPYRIIGVCVCDDRAYFQRRIAAILSAMPSRHDRDFCVAADEIEIWQDYVGLGYAISRPEELKAIIDLAQLEGIVLDPVYTGKAFYGLQQERQRGDNQLDGPIVFLHTGGIYGLFSKSAQLCELLDR